MSLLNPLVFTNIVDILSQVLDVIIIIEEVYKALCKSYGDEFITCQTAQFAEEGTETRMFTRNFIIFIGVFLDQVVSIFCSLSSIVPGELSSAKI